DAIVPKHMAQRPELGDDISGGGGHQPVLFHISSLIPASTASSSPSKTLLTRAKPPSFRERLSVECLAVHYDFPLNLFTNFPEPLFLRMASCTAGEDPLHRSFDPITVRHQRVTQGCLTDEADY